MKKKPNSYFLVRPGDWAEVMLSDGSIINIECPKDSISIVTSQGQVILTKEKLDNTWVQTFPVISNCNL